MDEVVTFTRIIPATETMFFIPAAAPFPLAGAVIDLFFSTSQYYDSDAGGSGQAVTSYVSCSRASTGYARTSAGTLTSFGVNTLRITTLGLLIEDARTNYVLRSQEIDNAGVWASNNQVTISANATAAPDGTTTADAVIPTAVSAAHFAGQSPTITAGLPSKVTFSVYAKNAGYNYAVLVVKVNGQADAYRILVNLTTGLVESAVVDGGSPTGVSYSVETLANGWFRIILTLDDPAVSSEQILLGVSDTGPNWNTSLTGDGTSGVYFWGAQLEVGAFASSYIPTAGATAVRAADAITNIGNLSTDIAAATGSIVGQTTYAGGTSFAANIVDSNGTNLLGFDATNHGLASIGATLATANTANRSTTADKGGLAWSVAGRSLVLNGGTVASDATAQTPNATQNLGSNGSTNFIYSYVQRLTVWTSKLADATLQGFTV